MESFLLRSIFKRDGMTLKAFGPTLIRNVLILSSLRGVYLILISEMTNFIVLTTVPLQKNTLDVYNLGTELFLYPTQLTIQVILS